MKEQRACGINQDAKDNAEVPWEREPCNCVLACAPLGDGGVGAHPTVGRGLLSFSPASRLPMSPIHSPPGELINIRREAGKEGENGGRGEGEAKRCCGSSGGEEPGQGEAQEAAL